MFEFNGFATTKVAVFEQEFNEVDRTLVTGTEYPFRENPTGVQRKDTGSTDVESFVPAESQEVCENCIEQEGISHLHTLHHVPGHIAPPISHSSPD